MNRKDFIKNIDLAGVSPSFFLEKIFLLPAKIFKKLLLMKKLPNLLLAVCAISLLTIKIYAQKTVRIYPKLIDSVLINPGIGFMTFQRFNGDTLNKVHWTEGFPIVYQKFDGNLENKEYPMTSIAYFRIYWRYLEPEAGKYSWSLIDKALETAYERHQTLMLRVAPYGYPVNEKTDVPAWYRSMVGYKKDYLPDGARWRVDPKDPRYLKYFGGLIAALGKRYDGNPHLLSVDLSIVGFWGEGESSNLLTQKTRKGMVNVYTDNFKKTPLIMQLTDRKTNIFEEIIIAFSDEINDESGRLILKKKCKIIIEFTLEESEFY